MTAYYVGICLARKMALADDGILYVWGGLMNTPLVTPYSSDVKLPTEIELPTGGMFNANPTKVTNISSYAMQCDDGGLYNLGNLHPSNGVTSFVDYLNPTFGNFLYSRFRLTDEGKYIRALGPQYGYKIMMSSDIDGGLDLLTNEGNMVGLGQRLSSYWGLMVPGAPDYPSNVTHPHGVWDAFGQKHPYSLIDGIFDVHNHRQTEDPADDQ